MKINRVFTLLMFVVLINITYSYDLTGKWYCDDGGTYYIRQVGNELFWYGEGLDWTNVAHGKVSGNYIILSWADVPKAAFMNEGILILRIISSNKLQAVYKTGGFAGSIWWR